SLLLRFLYSRDSFPPFFGRLQIARRSIIRPPRSTISSSSVAAVYDRRKLSDAGMVFLQTAHLHLTLLQRTDPVRTRLRRTHRRHDRNFLCQRRVSNHHFVLARDSSARCIDDEADVPVFDSVEHVRPAFVQFENFFHFDLRFHQRFSRSAR